LHRPPQPQATGAQPDTAVVAESIVAPPRACSPRLFAFAASDAALHASRTVAGGAGPGILLVTVIVQACGARGANGS